MKLDDGATRSRQHNDRFSHGRWLWPKAENPWRPGEMGDALFVALLRMFQ